MIEKITYQELYEAYLECRIHKRNTVNALKFEIDLESNLLQLLDEINNGTYQVGRSVVFIINKPVKREIFAADFRDRIVHHLIIQKTNWIFEKLFIYDSYSCRKGRGTAFAIKRLKRFLISCSHNFTQPCYVLKLDIQGFFMHINRKLLWQKVYTTLEEHYTEKNKNIIQYLCKSIIENNPIHNCIVRGNKSEWYGLPKNKSLFHSPIGCGLPIGNLTSQVFANLYLNDFDHYIKHTLGIRYYGRYVDDFVIVHTDKEYLKSLIPLLSEFLKTNLGLTLHPKKIYLQEVKKGVVFLGTKFYPHRLAIHHRTKSNAYLAIEKWNQVVRQQKPDVLAINGFISCVNSYWGLLQQYRTYRFRKKMFFEWMSGYWLNYVSSSGGYAKLRRR